VSHPFRYCLFLLLFKGINAGAQTAIVPKLIASRPVTARTMTTDELGNIYAVLADNTLARYNERGDSTGFYRSALNGEIGTVDATNPLRLLLYYPGFNKVQLLDRQLALKAEIDLRPLHIYSSTAVATASDGNIWVYDPFNAKIIKFDESGRQTMEGVDLRQQLPFVPKAQFLLERDRRLFLCDTTQGILVFDQFATYLTTLPFKSVCELQVFGQQVVFKDGTVLHRYNMQDLREEQVPLPGFEGAPPLEASLTQRTLTIRYAQQLAVYSWQESR
jgi:hypothetical protein